jgi:hypothetical protein
MIGSGGASRRSLNWRRCRLTITPMMVALISCLYVGVVGERNSSRSQRVTTAPWGSGGSAPGRHTKRPGSALSVDPGLPTVGRSSSPSAPQPPGAVGRRSWTRKRKDLENYSRTLVRSSTNITSA